MANEFTAQQLREMAKHLILDISDTDDECNEYRNSEGAFDLVDCENAFDYVAGVLERCEKLHLGGFGICDDDYNYILHGVEEKEEK